MDGLKEPHQDFSFNWPLSLVTSTWPASEGSDPAFNDSMDRTCEGYATIAINGRFVHVRADQAGPCRRPPDEEAVEVGTDLCDAAVGVVGHPADDTVGCPRDLAAADCHTCQGLGQAERSSQVGGHTSHSGK